MFSVPSPRQSTVAGLPPGLEGTRVTVEQMVKVIREAMADGNFRAAALSITKEIPERDTPALALALYRWVQAHFVYRHDPVGLESVSRPQYLLRQIRAGGKFFGDCDDATVMLASLAGVLGIPSRVRIVRFMGNASFSHVVASLQVLPGAWFEFDGTRRKGMNPALPPVEWRETGVIVP